MTEIVVVVVIDGLASHCPPYNSKLLILARQSLVKSDHSNPIDSTSFLSTCSKNPTISPYSLFFCRFHGGWLRLPSTRRNLWSSLGISTLKSLLLLKKIIYTIQNLIKETTKNKNTRFTCVFLDCSSINSPLLFHIWLFLKTSSICGERPNSFSYKQHD